MVKKNAHKGKYIDLGRAKHIYALYYMFSTKSICIL